MRNVAVVNLFNSLSQFQQPYLALLLSALPLRKHWLVTKKIMCHETVLATVIRHFRLAQSLCFRAMLNAKTLV